MRWAGFIKKLGYAVQISEAWSGHSVDMLIALHGLRSYSSIQRFKKAFPGKSIILMMTGTDLYRDMPNHPEVIQSMKVADAIVVLQPAALQSIPKHLQTKTHVIYQSVKSIKRKPPLKRHFMVCVIGHLRPEKDPFCTVRAISLLSKDSAVRVLHLGKAMASEMQKQAIKHTKQHTRYQWLGELSHAKTLQTLSKSHLMVISSFMEGGAHVVSEAIAIGIPVIASDIPGNRGLLGENYPGYFPAGDASALAALLQRAEAEPVFYQSLERHIQRRKKYIQPEFEMRSIQSLIKPILK